MDRPCHRCSRRVVDVPAYVNDDLVKCLACDDDDRRKRATDSFHAMLRETTDRVGRPDAPNCCIGCRAERPNDFAACEVCMAAAIEKQAELDHRRLLKPALESLPEGNRWATFGPTLTGLRAPPDVVAIVRAHPCDRLLLLGGGGGVGKTALASAKFTFEMNVPIAQKRWRYDSLFMPAWKLGQHRFEAKMGAPLALLRAAQDAHLLVLDDLGQEGESEQAQELMRQLLWARTESKLGTVVTTALTRDKLKARYNEGFYRRLTDRRICHVLSLSPPAPAARPNGGAT